MRKTFILHAIEINFKVWQATFFKISIILQKGSIDSWVGETTFKVFFIFSNCIYMYISRHHFMTSWLLSPSEKIYSHRREFTLWNNPSLFYTRDTILEPSWSHLRCVKGSTLLEKNLLIKSQFFSVRVVLYWPPSLFYTRDTIPEPSWTLLLSVKGSTLLEKNLLL